MNDIRENLRRIAAEQSRDRLVLLGAGASVCWLLLVCLFAYFGPSAESASSGIGRLLGFVGVVMPIALIWLAVGLGRSIASLQAEAAELRASVALLGRDGDIPAAPSIRHIPSAPRPAAAPSRPEAASAPGSDSLDAPALALDEYELISAINFPNGPEDEDAIAALRKALAMGVDDAVLLSDESIAGSDLPGTAWSLTCGIDAAMSALGLDDLKLIVTGNRSSDGLMGGMAGILSEYRTIPALTHLRSAAVNAAEGTVTGVRETPRGEFELAATLPAVISVTDQADRPRFPNFKGIMAAKKAQITRLSLADTAATAEQVGGAHAATAVTAAAERPERSQGEIIRDNGEAAVAIADFLESRNLI